MTRRTLSQLALASLVAIAVPLGAHAMTAKGNSATHESHKGAHKHAAMTRIDLNTASEQELAALPGIGDATAEKIVSGRPYKNSSQLTAKGILTKEEFSKIRNRVMAHQAAESKKSVEKSVPNTSATPGSSGSSEGTTK